MDGGGEELGAGGFGLGDFRFQGVGPGQQLADLGDDSLLLGERWEWDWRRVGQKPLNHPGKRGGEWFQAEPGGRASFRPATAVSHAVPPDGPPTRHTAPATRPLSPQSATARRGVEMPRLLERPFFPKSQVELWHCHSPAGLWLSASSRES